MSQLDRILRGFHKTIKKLDTYATVMQSQAERNRAEMASLNVAAEECVTEAERANNIANKLKELVS